MNILFRFGRELFWTVVWVFIALIIGYAILTWLAARNIPLVSTASSWVEKYSTAR